MNITKLLDDLKKHSGKSATLAGGGLSLAAALMLFATKNEMDLLRERQAETWIAVQNIQMVLMQRANNTNSAVIGEE